MKRTSNKWFLYSLTSLTVLASGLAYAELPVSAPTLEGGVTVAIGTFYVSPSSDAQDYAVKSVPTGTFLATDQQVLEVNPGYDFGFEAALGYIFEDTANGVELLYRTVHNSDDASASDNLAKLFIPVLDQHFTNATSNLEYDLNAVDLMFSQFLDIGTHMQMRFSLGASYLDLEKEQNNFYFGDATSATKYQTNSDFSGFGPRLGTDARYDFGQGFGILAGASLAYYLGDMDVDDSFSSNKSSFVEKTSDDSDNHGVTNLRGNVAIDYVYFFENEELSTVGVELGYLVDYYADATKQLGYSITGQGKLPSNVEYDGSSDSNSLTYSGPYLNIKAAF